jgi:multicomponent Na+:H+ antiporter subunit B
MIELFSFFLLSMLVITALAMVSSRHLFVTVMLSGIFSLLIAAIFLLLDAADVALTEAAVGAGISTVLFLGALSLMDVEETVRHERWLRVFSLVVVAITTLVVVYATFDIPAFGDPNAPIHLHVAPWYIQHVPIHMDIPNIVTGILGSYRGYDTLGEVFVVFTAGIGVLSILGDPVRQRHNRLASPTGLRHYLIPRVVGRLLIPFIVLFGLYVQFHGEYSPGGGFQAGALVAAAVILYAILEGEDKALQVIPMRGLYVLMASGALLYGGVGVVTMLLGGNFLEYGVLADSMVAGQQWGILLIEAGVGLTVTGVLLTIFHAFAARSSL